MLGLSLAIRVGKRVLGGLIDSLMSAIKGRATYSENIADSKQVVKDIDNYELLDKASILLTPTAYSDARVHSVKTYTGDELVTNGTYSTDLSGWTNTNTHWQWSSGSAYHPLTTSFNPLKQDITNNVGAVLRITFDLTYVQGTAQCFYKNEANSDVSTTFTSSGSYTIITEPVKANTEINFGRAFGHNTEFYIDNVSVVDVSSDFDFDRASSATRINSDGLVQDMQSITDPELVLNGDFEELGNEVYDDDITAAINGGTWVDNGNGTFTVTGDGSPNTGIGVRDAYADYLTNGKTYKWTVEGGNVTLALYDNSYALVTSGTSPLYFTATATNRLYISPTDGVSATYSNVSIKQVDPNDRWTVTDSDANNYVEFTEGFARLKFLNTSPVTNFKTSNSILQGGQTYKLVVDVHDVTSGGIKIDGSGISETFNTEGVTTRYITPTGSTALTFYRATANVDITLASVSVKDITFSEDVDLARINYDSNGENGHWLLEPTSTNLITYSEEISQYTSAGVSVIDNDTTSPSGLTNASKITETAGGSLHYVDFSLTGTANEYSWSCFLKQGTTRYAGMRAVVNGFANRFFVNVDLSNGSVVDTETVGSGVTWEYSVEEYSNGWYRLIINAPNTSGNMNLAISPSDAAQPSYSLGLPTFLGNTSNNFYVWGVQLETLSYATSYIPTYGSTVTRATETLTGSGNSTLINSTEGVLYAEIAALADDGTARNMALSDGTTSNRIVMVYTNVSNQIRFYLEGTGGTITVNHTLTNSTELVKAAVRYKSQDFAFYINGVQIDTNNSSITFSGLNDLSFYNPFGGGSSPFYGKCKELAVFDEALTDDELELLTGITNYGSFNELAQANGYTII